MNTSLDEREEVREEVDKEIAVPEALSDLGSHSIADEGVDLVTMQCTSSPVGYDLSMVMWKRITLVGNC
jgi:hypothetical protein